MQGLCFVQNGHVCGLYFMNNRSSFVSLICYDISNIFKFDSLYRLLFVPCSFYGLWLGGWSRLG